MWMTTLAAMLASAAPYGQVAIQGALTDTLGAPLNGTRQVVVGLYDAPTGGTELWTDDPVWQFHDGAFAASLGESNDLDLAKFATNANVYLQIAVDGVAASRVAVGYVPKAAYAIRAGDAATLEGATRADLTYSTGTGLTRTGNEFRVDGAWLAGQTRSSTWVPAWTDVTGRPAGLDDGDDNTTYSKGTGLSLSGTQFSVDAAWLAGQTRSSTWVPAWTDVTGRPTPGAGLTASGSTWAIDEFAGGPLVPNARFQTGNTTGWTSHSGGGTVENVGNSPGGTYAIQNNPGSVWWAYSDTRIPIRPGQDYRVSGAFRRTDTTGTAGTYYLAVALFDASGANINGDGTWWYYPINGDVLRDTAWHSYYADFGPSFNRSFPSNAVTMSAGVILNYGSGGNRTYQATNIQLRAIEGNKETVPQEVFRVGTGSFTTTSRSWVSHASAASGQVLIGNGPFNYQLYLTGDWTDAEGKHMAYRLKFSRVDDPAVVTYLPSADGHTRYIYIDEKRLEEFAIPGVARLSPGRYNVQLEVVINSTATAAYRWDAVYGQIHLMVW